MKTHSILMIILLTILSSCTKSISKKDIRSYTLQGNEIAQATQKTLGSNLSQKMKNGGVEAAIPFCNTMAMPLTAKMEAKYEVTIKRVSSKIRNEANSPSRAELKTIEIYQDLLLSGRGLDPVIEDNNENKIHYYAPILMQKKCLTCHGVLGAELTAQTDSLIKSIYPNDKATGFKEGELRGIWSITFTK